MKKIILTAVIFFVFGLIFSVPKISYAASCDCLADGFGGCMLNTNNCVGDNSPKCSVESGGFCSCSCVANPTPTVTPVKVCDFAGSAAKQQKCEQCMGTGTGAWTALGCIKTDPQQFIGEILKIAVGIGGGIAFLLILFGGFQILTSAGNPEKLNAGKELVTSAITGLLIIIFSLFILRLIGYNILGIPKFG